MPYSSLRVQGRFILTVAAIQEFVLQLRQSLVEVNGYRGEGALVRKVQTSLVRFPLHQRHQYCIVYHRRIRTFTTILTMSAANAAAVSSG